ncbi:MAG: nucleotidyltransferase domain-containing protein [Deltaproteobacteria bacterium]|nr:nucleotidyltransferase domain-containing protein [Deltaproteobacteria bacterium]
MNRPTGASLVELAGGWSEKDAREFDESVRFFEKIDKEIPSGKALGARSGKIVAPVGFPPVTRGQLRRVGEKIAGLPGVEKVILFGSYARGNPTPDSDVHLLVVWKTRRPRTDRWMAVSTLFSRRPFPMDIVVRTPREIKDALIRKDCFIREIVSTGKVLYEKE